MDAKKWYQSKTVWFNIATAAVTVASELTNTFPASQHVAVFTTIATVGNLFLRAISNTTLTK